MEKVIKAAFALGMVFMMVSCEAPKLLATALPHVIAAVDSTTLYTYSKDAYVESVIRGRQKDRHYRFAAELPYYSSILSGAKLESAEPLGIMPAGAVAELGTAIRKGAEVWIPVSFYVEDTPYQAFALFPREWEGKVRVYDWNAETAKIRTAYQTYVKTNFELMEVKPANEKDYKEKYNDYFKVREIGGKDTVFFYAPKTDKAHIDAAYSYFLNSGSINMVLLQTDKEWKRPPFDFNKSNPNKTEE